MGTHVSMKEVQIRAALKRIVGNTVETLEPIGGVELCLRYERGQYVAELHPLGDLDEIEDPVPIKVRGPDLDAVLLRLEQAGPGDDILLSEDDVDLCSTCGGEGLVLDAEASENRLIECSACGDSGGAGSES